MDNKFERWYDKYPDLKSLLQLLENVDEYNIELIAQDFIQIIMEKYKDKFDNVIADLSHNAPPGYKRWYDRNYNLHTCVEFIKTIEDEDEKNELINSFIMALLSYVASADNG